MPSPATNAALVRWRRLVGSPPEIVGLEAARWDWYALLRLIQCAYPDRPRIGYGSRPSTEPVRLGQTTFFHHPSTTVAGLDPASLHEPDAPGPPEVPWLYCFHLGFFGPNGPLPLHLTEFGHRRLREERGAAFFAFCNALTHRFLAYFFRAWAAARREIAFDRPHALTLEGERHAREDVGEHGEQWWEFAIGSLLGCGLDSLLGRDRVPERSKLYYAGRLVSLARNAEGLEFILEDYFAVCTRILEFQPRRLPIPEEARWRLGESDGNGHLGWSTILGASVYDYQSGFRIRLGPVSLSQLENFLPGTDGFRELHDWIRFYVGKETDPNSRAGIESAWDVQIVLDGPQVPKLTLGSEARLGWTTWLFSKAPTRDVDDLVLRPLSDRVEPGVAR